MTAEALVAFGDTVKALPDGKVAGYLIRFGSPSQTDLVRDYFTAETNFDFANGETKSVYYAHGQDEQVGKRRIGRGSLKSDEVGVWVEAQLDLADEYQAAIYELAKKEKLGWSSGSAAHLVERKAAENGAKHITQWPLVEASLTPQPCEPRCVAVATLKSLLTDLSGEDQEPQAGSTFAEHSESALAAISDFADRAQSLKALRAQDGRQLSSKASALISSTADELSAIADQLKALTAPEYVSEQEASRAYAEFLELTFRTTS